MPMERPPDLVAKDLWFVCGDQSGRTSAPTNPQAVQVPPRAPAMTAPLVADTSDLWRRTERAVGDNGNYRTNPICRSSRGQRQWIECNSIFITLIGGAAATPSLLWPATRPLKIVVLDA
jgi:hypothetical protein